MISPGDRDGEPQLVMVIGEQRWRMFVVTIVTQKKDGGWLGEYRGNT